LDAADPLNQLRRHGHVNSLEFRKDFRDRTKTIAL
jgi:hypothetical protein